MMACVAFHTEAASCSSLHSLAQEDTDQPGSARCAWVGIRMPHQLNSPAGIDQHGNLPAAQHSPCDRSDENQFAVFVWQTFNSINPVGNPSSRGIRLTCNRTHQLGRKYAERYAAHKPAAFMDICHDEPSYERFFSANYRRFQ